VISLIFESLDLQLSEMLKKLIFEEIQSILEKINLESPLTGSKVLFLVKHLILNV
jgi:hypothetical protein